jgi:hypothetical protein
MNRSREMVKKILMAAPIPSVLATAIFAPPPDSCPPLVIFMLYEVCDA